MKKLMKHSIFLISMLSLSSAAQAYVPECNARAVVDDLIQQDNIARQMFTSSSVRAVELKNIRQIGSNEVMRACTATIRRTNNTTEDIGYTVEWLDINAGLFLAKTISLKTLYKEWGTPQQQAQTPQQQNQTQNNTNNGPVSYESCMSEAGGSMPMMTDCENYRLSIEDKRLNDLYKKVMAGLSQNEKTALRDRQRLWIKLRDADCKIDPDGGQAAQLDHASCLAEKTKLRADELQRML